VPALDASFAKLRRITGIAKQKQHFPLKKSPLNTQFFAFKFLSLAKHAVVSRKSANQLQHSCNPLAVVLRIIRSTAAEASQ